MSDGVTGFLLDYRNEADKRIAELERRLADVVEVSSRYQAKHTEPNGFAPHCSCDMCGLARRASAAAKGISGPE